MLAQGRIAQLGMVVDNDRCRHDVSLLKDGHCERSRSIICRLPGDVKPIREFSLGAALSVAGERLYLSRA